MTAFDYALAYIRKNGFPLSSYLPKAGKYKQWEIRHKHFPAGSELDAVSVRMSFLSGVPRAKVRLDHPWAQANIYEKGQLWMSTNPIETFTHIYPIYEAHGDVLVGGLGLGYVAYEMLTKNPKVTSVTVVEINKDLITFLSPILSSPKLEIVHADIFDMLAIAKPRFDFIYLDIWRDTGESEFNSTVVPLRKLARKAIRKNTPAYRRKNVVCWMEDEMRGQILRGTQQVFMLTSQDNLQKMLNTPKDLDFLKKWKAPVLELIQAHGLDKLYSLPQKELAALVTRHVGNYVI